MVRSSLVLISALLIHQVVGHGFMSEPPQRSSMWRAGFNTPPNYTDGSLNCGGFDIQWQQNEGKCGLCGDDYALPTPRPNEAGGTYGTSTIAREYKEGDTIQVSVNISASHVGWFEFHLCARDDPSVAETEDCFYQHVLELADGSGTRYPLDNYNSGIRTVELLLPAGVTCSNCVLRWHWECGNRYGPCDDGTSAMGCGIQETYRNCADVAIN